MNSRVGDVVRWVLFVVFLIAAVIGLWVNSGDYSKFARSHWMDTDLILGVILVVTTPLHRTSRD